MCMSMILLQYEVSMRMCKVAVSLPGSVFSTLLLSHSIWDRTPCCSPGPELTGCMVPAAISPAGARKHVLMLYVHHASQQRQQEVQVSGMSLEQRMHVSDMCEESRCRHALQQQLLLQSALHIFLLHIFFYTFWLKATEGGGEWEARVGGGAGQFDGRTQEWRRWNVHSQFQKTS